MKSDPKSHRKSFLPVESVLDRLVRMEARCEPSGFGYLLKLVNEFVDAASTFTNLRPLDLETALSRLCLVGNSLLSSVNESFLKGLLREDTEQTKVTPLDKLCITLTRGLHSPVLRAQFLQKLIHSSLGFVSVFALTVDPRNVTAGQILVQAVRNFPSLAKLAWRCDCTALSRIHRESLDVHVRLLREVGYELIDIVEATAGAELLAWDAWIRAAQARGQEKLSLLDQSAEELRTLANFLVFVDVVPWIIKPFYRLQSGSSMTAIVCALSRRTLEIVPRQDEVYRLFWRNSVRSANSDPPIKLCRLTVGIVRRTQYIVRVPEVQFFIKELDRFNALKWADSPVRFMREHADEIPFSYRAQETRIQLENIEQAVLGAKLEKEFSGTLEELTPDILAFLFVEGAGLPHAAAIGFAFFFRRLFRLLKTHES